MGMEQLIGNWYFSLSSSARSRAACSSSPDADRRAKFCQPRPPGLKRLNIIPSAPSAMASPMVSRSVGRFSRVATNTATTRCFLDFSLARARVVLSKAPGAPDISSWMARFADSSGSSQNPMASPASAASRSSSSKVPLVMILIFAPRPARYATSCGKSSRRSGSPPVRVTSFAPVSSSIFPYMACVSAVGSSARG